MNATVFQRLSLGHLLLVTRAVLSADPETESGWSIEAKMLDVESSGTVSGFTFDGEESGASLGLGYGFSERFAVQVGYHDLGEHFATDCPPSLVCVIENVDQIDVTGLSVSAIGTWPITSAFELYGKFGVMGWDADFLQLQRDDSDRDWVYGAGIGYWLSPNWRLSLQYEKVEAVELESTGLGFSYRF